MAFKIVFLALDETLEVIISLIHGFRNVSMNICAPLLLKKNSILVYSLFHKLGLFVKTTQNRLSAISSTQSIFSIQVSHQKRTLGVFYKKFRLGITSDFQNRYWPRLIINVNICNFLPVKNIRVQSFACYVFCVSPLQLNNNSKLPFLLLFRHVVFYFRALILLYYKFDVRPINLNRDKATPFIRVNLSHNLL